jgi:ActR/RegA family two-component response regulator
VRFVRFVVELKSPSVQTYNWKVWEHMVLPAILLDHTRGQHGCMKGALIVAQLLLVADDATLQHKISPSLYQAGFHVLISRTIVEAQARLRDTQPAVLLFDMALTTSTLAELLEVLRPMPSAPLVIGIAADHSAAVEALRLGAFDQLCTPLNYELLHAAVTRAAEHYQLRTQAREVALLRASEANLHAAVRTTAHNLSQYLTVIMGETQLLQEELDDPEVSASLTRILHAAEQATQTLVELRIAREIRG